MRIVGVHGVGNHDAAREPAEAAARLSRIWADALGGPHDLRVAYYAHHLKTRTGQSGADIDHLDPGAEQFVLAWGAALGAPAELAQGRATAPLRHLADWVARRFGLDSAAVRWFVAVFFAEVATYLAEAGDTDGTVRAAARDEVARTILEHEPQVVIAHSLGSIVAYEALHANPSLAVDLLVTVGSPLAMPDVVYPRLRPAALTGTRPAGVRRWVNIADVGDLVAIPRRLGGRFATDVDHEESVALFDFHRVRAYLAAARLREAIGS
ncbi:hypothetical protein ACFPIJ_33305 [Dactylosporangium cerinum]|uniref:Serine peptidase n=1 Tax=Dactylosporangium cerinum TaxID=1434730 RepID=A0ABV9W515_9ACTN